MKIYLREIFRNQMTLYWDKRKRGGKRVVRRGFVLPVEFIKQFMGKEAYYYEQMAWCNPYKACYCWISKDIIHMWLKQKKD